MQYGKEGVMVRGKGTGRVHSYVLRFLEICLPNFKELHNKVTVRNVRRKPYQCLQNEYCEIQCYNKIHKSTVVLIIEILLGSTHRSSLSSFLPLLVSDYGQTTSSLEF